MQKNVFRVATHPGNNNTGQATHSLWMQRTQRGSEHSVSIQFDINKASSEASKAPQCKSEAKHPQQASLSVFETIPATVASSHFL